MRRSLRVVFAVLSFWLACSSLLWGSEWRQLVRGPVVLACRDEDVKNDTQGTTHLPHPESTTEHWVECIEFGKVSTSICG